MKKNPLMTAIRMHDKTIMYTKNIQIEKDIWTLYNVRSPSLSQRIEKFELHKDAIEVYFHILEGGLNEEVSED